MNSKNIHDLLKNLIHPAFLGAAIVGVVDHLFDSIYGDTSATVFALIGSFVLILYFVLDYLVLLENGPNESLIDLVCDTGVLVALNIAIRFAWVEDATIEFFVTLLAIPVLYFVKELRHRDWSYLSWLVVVVVIICGIVASNLLLTFQPHVKFTGLLVLFGISILYYKYATK